MCAFLEREVKERLVPLGSYAQRALEDYIVRASPHVASHGKGTAALFLNGRGAGWVDREHGLSSKKQLRMRG